MKRKKWNIHDSHFCYTYYSDKKVEEHEIDMLEGIVCSDSESGNPDEWIDVANLRTKAGKS